AQLQGGVLERGPLRAWFGREHDQHRPGRAAVRGLLPERPIRQHAPRHEGRVAHPAGRDRTRFHLLKNVGDALEPVLQGHPEALRAAARPEPPAPTPPVAVVAEATTASDVAAPPAPPLPPRLRRGDQRLAERYARVRALADAGYGV